MEMNVINKQKKKRAVNKQEWTKEKRKRLRIAGKEYVNAKGEVISEKAPGPDCNCRRKCYDRVPIATRMKLFNGYYALKSHDEQNAYLFGLIRKVPIARKRAEGSTRRTCTFNYYIRFGGQETQVCVKALANIHGVGKSKIHILCEKLGQNVLFPRDERGRHSKMPKKVSDDTVELAKQHIYSIIHSERARDFLKDEKANNGPDVNITQMHKDFLDNYDPAFTQEMANYEKAVGHQECANCDYNTSDYMGNCEYKQSHDEYEDHNGDSSEGSIQVMIDSEGNTHEVMRPDLNMSQNQTMVMTSVSKKKRKTTRDGRPEPLMRQWFYSKIFHDIYTTKEALSLRKKILSWKCSDDFITVKPMRKQKSPKKHQGAQIQHVIVQEPMESGEPQMTAEQPQVQFIQARLNKGTFSIPITTPHIQQNKKIIHEVQIQSIPLKKKQVQVYQTQGQDMYSIYPMILQDLSQLDTHTVNSAQLIQPTQIRTIAPTHFQTSVPQPVCTPMTITTGALQTLGVNIGIAPNGTHYSTANGPQSLHNPIYPHDALVTAI